MPYQNKWIPAAAAAAHVMQVDGCDRLAAMCQIEAAARDGELRWVRGGSNRWGWDAEVLRADLRKLWASPADKQKTPDQELEGLKDDLREAAAWHTRPLPKPTELRRATELLAGLKESIRKEIELRDQAELPADLLEHKFSEAAEDIDGEVLAWLGQGRLAAYLETPWGLERLPYGAYWVSPDGGATPLAWRALVEGIAASNRRSGSAGTVKFRDSDFDAFTEAYKATRSFGGVNPGACRFLHPVWDLRDVFGWVLDRDPARFGRINSETDWHSAAWAARFYTVLPGKEFDRLADQTLLHALQRGELAGYSGTSRIPREFWIDKTELTLRNCAANFFREEVLALWPDPRTRTSRLPEPIRPLTGSRAFAVCETELRIDRIPAWHIWKNVPQLRVFEAVALSLNIDPKKVRRNPRGWMAGKHLFEEDQEFNDRLFVAEQSVGNIRVLNRIGAHYEGQEPIIQLDSFIRWALGIGWVLPAELVDSTAAPEGELPPAPHERKSEVTDTAQLPPRIGIQRKRDAVKAFVAQRYPDGIPPGTTVKHIVREFVAETHVRVDVRTVMRALGRR